MGNIDYKIRFPKDEVMQKTYEANLRRFAELLGIEPLHQNSWYHASELFMPVVRKDSILYCFHDSLSDESAIFNEHGVCVYKDFSITGEFV